MLQNLKSKLCRKVEEYLFLIMAISFFTLAFFVSFFVFH
jgi:hypothetical protein